MSCFPAEPAVWIAFVERVLIMTMICFLLGCTEPQSHCLSQIGRFACKVLDWYQWFGTISPTLQFAYASFHIQRHLCAISPT